MRCSYEDCNITPNNHWSHMPCRNPDPHLCHAWESEFTHYGPYLCHGIRVPLDEYDVERVGVFAHRTRSLKDQVFTLRHSVEQDPITGSPHIAVVLSAFDAVLSGLERAEKTLLDEISVFTDGIAHD